jgi:hypothetical protein
VQRRYNDAFDMKVRMWKFNIQKLLINFYEKEPSAKDPPGSHDIIIVASRHVEVIILLQKA